MSRQGWDHESEGPAAVAQMDQIRTEMIDIIREAPVVWFLAKRPGHEQASVRSFASLPLTLSDEERHEYMLQFFRTARRELDEMVDALESGDPE